MCDFNFPIWQDLHLVKLTLILMSEPQYYLYYTIIMFPWHYIVFITTTTFTDYDHDQQYLHRLVQEQV